MLIAVHFGIEAVAVAILVRELILLPYSFFLMNKVLEFKYSALSKRLRSPVIGSFFMVIGIYVARLIVNEEIVSAVYLSLILLISIIIYAATLFVVDRELVREALLSGKLVLASGGNTKQSKA